MMSPVVVEVLRVGLYDWLDLGLLTAIVREREEGRDGRVVLMEALQLIEYLLDEGLAEAGDVSDEFTPWAISASESIDRIRREWAALPRDPQPGDICWLNLTQKGQRAAELSDHV